MLQGLHDLLYWHLPPVFIMGHMVRRLSWEGRPGEGATGEVAQRLLCYCLLVQTQLQSDWDCKLEYTGTISMALLSWQPWVSALPGCCFVEEACEALLSRMAHRCRTHRHLTGFDSTQELFVSLPTASDEPHQQKGNVRRELVQLMVARLQGILHNSGTLKFARYRSIKESVWEAEFPEDWTFPGIPVALDASAFIPVLRSAAASVAGACEVSPLTATALQELVPAVLDGDEARRRQGELSKCAVWARERAGRRRTSRPKPSAAPVHPGDVATSSSAITSATSLAVLVVDTSAGDDGEDDGSLYEPPPTVDGAEDDDQSFGDTDLLGSVGDLVADQSEDPVGGDDSSDDENYD